MIKVLNQGSKMKLRIMSDLHNEFGRLDVPEMGWENEQVLVLAGDVGLFSDTFDYCEFLFELSPRFKKILVVPGNHEFYNGDMEHDLNEVQKEIESSKYDNIHIMDDNTIDIDGVIFIGSTLWTDMDRGNVMCVLEATSRMNDFRLIRVDGERFDQVNWNNLNKVGRSYIQNRLADNQDKKVVVITHHAPSFKSISEGFKGSALNGAYANTGLEDLMEIFKPLVWIHGHTHNTFDYNIGDTRIICNPRGYVGNGENPRFNPELVIQI